MATVLRKTSMATITLVGTTWCNSCQNNVDVVNSSMWDGVWFVDNHTMVLNNSQKGTPFEQIGTCFGSLGRPVRDMVAPVE